MDVFIATYRIQFNGDFGFDRGAAEVPYLKELGISHLYASPCLTAVTGSPHGYDVTDFAGANPELGGNAAYERMCETLQHAGMGQVLDIVPNHMATDSRRNAMWRDVLEFGLLSPYAGFFDIDWQSPDEKIRHKVLLPILGDHYNTCLEKGEFQFRMTGSQIRLNYYDHDLPVSMEAMDQILDSTELRLSLPGVRRQDLNMADHGQAINQVLEKINHNPDRVHELIEMQHYRPAYWRTAAFDINFRRFFDINDLVGVCVEKEEVFKKAHRLIFDWVHKGFIDGLRIDHPDGLSDPEGYLAELSRNAPHTRVWVEKILTGNERLPANWPVVGSTGYDFLNLVNGLYVDPEGEVPLTRLYEEITGEPSDYAETVRSKKHLVLEKSFSGEIALLTRLLVKIRFAHRPYRDLIERDLRAAVTEIAACFPVYRTYIRPDLMQVSSIDMQRVKTAISRAQFYLPRIDPLVWDFLDNLFMLRVRGETETRFILRFQQFTGPAMAKGVEDTTFYSFNRLTSLNEVGGEPGGFGTSLERFHEVCRTNQAETPETLLATATHDTKRGEDARIRINLLSEIAEEWSGTVKHWMEMTGPYRERDLPDPNTLYLIFQTLVGAWPIDRQRLTDYMLKAVKEAKIHTTWTETNTGYESSLSAFIAGILSDTAFVRDVERFTASLLGPAWISSLSQVLIKCTAPGIPDFYQGTELWDLNLVDPDNRRPIDFDLRRRLLTELQELTVPEILSRAESGLPKLFVIKTALKVRHLLPDEFGPKGGYRPLWAKGSKAGHVVAFMRGDQVITIAPRLIVGWKEDWGNTVLQLPSGTWKNVFTNEEWQGNGHGLSVLLGQFPVALLVKR